MSCWFDVFFSLCLLIPCLVLSLLSESESLFVSSGASAFVLHNGERLIFFDSAPDRDSAAIALNCVLWGSASTDSDSAAVLKMKMARVNTAHVPC